MRSVLVLLLVLSGGAAEAREPSINEKLLEFYGKKQNYQSVKKEVLAWHGTTKNACVAFLSTALRRIGVDVPQDGTYDGEKVSRLTRPFSLWLEEVAGWERISDADDLRPGDIVFTERADYPWHTYVFKAWKNKKKGIAWVIDNQGCEDPSGANADDTPLALCAVGTDGKPVWRTPLGVSAGFIFDVDGFHLARHGDWVMTGYRDKIVMLPAAR